MCVIIVPTDFTTPCYGPLNVYVPGAKLKSQFRGRAFYNYSPSALSETVKFIAMAI